MRGKRPTPHAYCKTLLTLASLSVAAQWLGIAAVLTFGNTLYAEPPPDQMLSTLMRVSPTARGVGIVLFTAHVALFAGSVTAASLDVNAGIGAFLLASALAVFSLSMGPIAFLSDNFPRAHGIVTIIMVVAQVFFAWVSAGTLRRKSWWPFRFFTATGITLAAIAAFVHGFCFCDLKYDWNNTACNSSFLATELIYAFFWSLTIIALHSHSFSF